MKKIAFVFFLASLLTEASCQDKKNVQGAQTAQPGSVNQTISVDEFDKKLSELKDVQLIDVRTPEEFSEGSLKSAVSIDWRGADFAERVSKLDKSKPVMVYCLGGGRSAAAAEKLSQLGFSTVYNMEGGYLKWTSANKPVVTPDGSQGWKGMTMQEYAKLTNSDKQYVLVDFNAAWCGPCRQMMPMLEKITAERKDKVTFVKIDADQNKNLLKEKGIDAIPYFEVYEKGQLKWKLHGFMDEKTFLRESGL